jgi:hypothetical protein
MSRLIENSSIYMSRSRRFLPRRCYESVLRWDCGVIGSMLLDSGAIAVLIRKEST